jgi:hypothetical protein
MIFQVLDSKDGCLGIYQDGELLFGPLPNDLEKTWDYSIHLKDKDIKYAHLYSGGKSIDECCPDHLKDDWERVNKKIKAFINSFIESKVSLKENCIYDLVPPRYLKEFYDVKCKITEHVFRTTEEPREYQFIKDFSELIGDISARNLNLDSGWLSEKLWDLQAKKLWAKVIGGQTSIEYNMFGSVTGRLTVTEDSFPILNLNKNLRTVIKPQNDWFVELDLNAAELRVARALLNNAQIAGDHHEWSAKNIFNSELTRTEAKETATSWLYGSHAKLAVKYDKELEAFYKKEALKASYWVDGVVNTPFNRTIPADDHHVISYLNQSTLIDLFHRQILKMNKLLNNKKSFISFLVHDCLVLDLAEEDKPLLVDLIRTLSDTQWGTFPVNVKIGSNYGEMKKVKLKV